MEASTTETKASESASKQQEQSSLSSSSSSSQHKICLVAASPSKEEEGGGRRDGRRRREILQIRDAMTMQELAVQARTFLELVDDDDKSVILASGYPFAKTLEWQYQYSDALVKDVLPHMSRVECKIGNAIKNKSTPDDPQGDQVEEQSLPSRKKQKISKQPPKDQVVDLTSDTEEENNNDNDPVCVAGTRQSTNTEMQDDEAFARRLQQEEAAQAQHGLSTKPSSTTNTATNNHQQKQQQLDDPRHPSSVTEHDNWWIWQTNGQELYRNDDKNILGKWLVFRPEHDIDTTWNQIAHAVQAGQLHAPRAKVSTKFNQQHTQSQTSSSSSSYVICVYTSQERMDEVGMQLIHMVQHEIRYKTDEMTARGVYAHNNSTPNTKVTAKTLYWNKGRPSTTKAQFVPKLMNPEQSLTLAKQAALAANDSSFVPFDGCLVKVVALQHYYYKKDDEATMTTTTGSPLPPLQAGVTKLVLVRQPENQYDKNAIAVYLALSDASFDTNTATQVGFMNKKQAQVLSPWMDRDLIQFDAATVNHCIGKTILFVKVKGKGCPQAKDVLGGF